DGMPLRGALRAAPRGDPRPARPEARARARERACHARMGALDLPAPRSPGRAALAAPLVPGLRAQETRARLWHPRALQAATGHGRAPPPRAAGRFVPARADPRARHGARAGGPPDLPRLALLLPGDRPRYAAIALCGPPGATGSSLAALRRKAAPPRPPP